MLDLGPHHDSRRVTQIEQRDVERIANLHETRTVVSAVRVDGAAEVHGIVGDHADLIEKMANSAFAQRDPFGQRFVEPARRLTHQCRTRIGEGKSEQTFRPIECKLYGDGSAG